MQSSIGQGCDYFPVDFIKVFDAMPATLAKKDYSATGLPKDSNVPSSVRLKRTGRG
jgi:hypothetical protein